MADRKLIVIKDDRMWPSIVSDCFTFVMIASLTLLGWWAGSSALQWIGGLMAIMVVTSRAFGDFYKKQFTIETARLELDRLERETV